MVQDKRKTKAQLIDELDDLRQQVRQMKADCQVKEQRINCEDTPTSDYLERLLQAASAVQEAETEVDALQVIADAIQQSGWDSVAAHSYIEWERVHSAFAGLTKEQIAFLKNDHLPPAIREAMFSEERAQYRVSRSYLVPGEDVPALVEGRELLESSRPVQPGDTWDPCDLAYVPLYARDSRVIGSIALDNPIDGQRPTEEQFRYLEFFADLGARSIENIRTHKEHEQTALALQQSTRRYDLATSVAHVGVWDLDLLDNSFYLDPNVKTLLGYSDNEIPNDLEAWSQYVHPDDRELVSSTVQDHLQGNTPEFNLKHRMMHKDGSVRWIHAKGVAMRDTNGEPIRLIGTDMDVTRQVKAEEAVRDSESRYRELFDSVMEGIGQVDENENIQFCNRAWATIFEEDSAEHLIGRSLLDFMPDDQRDIIFSGTEERKKGIPSQYEMDIVTRSGKRKTILVSVSPRFDINARFIGSFGAFIDITQRKLFEKQLRESRERLQGILTHSPSVIFLKDVEGRYLLINRKYEELFHISNDQIIGKTDYDVFPKDAAETFLRNDQKVISAGSPMMFDEEVPQDDGVHSYLSLKFPIRDKDGEIAGICGVATDFTERKNMETELQANEERFREIADVASSYVYTSRINEDQSNVREWTSENYKILFGYTREEVEKLEGGYRSIIHPDDLSIYSRRINRLLNGESDITEYRIIHKSGEVRWIRAFGKPIWDAVENRVIRLHGGAEDITQRKKMELELLANEERFHAISDMASNYVYTCRVKDDRSTVREWISGDYNKLFGYTTDEVKALEHGFQSIVHPDDLHLHLQRRERLLRGEEDITEYRIIHKSGKTRWIRAYGKPVRDETTGKVVRFHAGAEDITRRKQVEEELRESEAQFRAIFETATDSIYIKDLQSRYVHVNPAMAKIFNRSLDEFVGMSPDEMFDRENAQKIRSIDQRVFAGEIVEEEDHREVDGEIRIFNIVNAPMRDRDGEIIGSCGIARDMTGRKKSQEALQESRTQLLAAQRVASIGNWSHDLVTGNKEWSDEIYRILGVEKQEPSVELILSCLHPDDRDLFLKTLEHAHKYEDTFDIDIRVIHPDGSIRYIHDRGQIQRDGFGTPLRMMGTIQDITLRKETELRFQASEEKLRNIIEHSSNLFYSHTPDHVLTYLSPQTREFFDCEPEEAQILWTELATDNPVNERGYELTQRAIDTGERQDPYELELIGNKGRKIWVQVQETPVVKNGKTVAIVGALTDITAQKQAEEEQLRQAEKERMLLRELDHRVRNNLSSLDSLIGMTAKEADDIPAFAQSVRARVQAMAMVHAILTSRQWGTVSLCALLQHVTTGDHRGRLEVDGPDVEIPAGQVQAMVMVMNELTTNSLKYGALGCEQGVVRVSWRWYETNTAHSRLRFRWSEQSVNPIADTPCEGMGLKLIRGLVQADLHGDVTFEFPAEGAKCFMNIQLSAGEIEENITENVGGR